MNDLLRNIQELYRWMHLGKAHTHTNGLAKNVQKENFQVVPFRRVNQLISGKKTEDCLEENEQVINESSA